MSFCLSEAKLSNIQQLSKNSYLCLTGTMHKVCQRKKIHIYILYTFRYYTIKLHLKDIDPTLLVTKDINYLVMYDRV